MRTTSRSWQAIAAFSGFMAIAMGAVGAHATSSPHFASLVEKASFYQLLHALLLLWLCEREGIWLRATRWFVVMGTLLFCGSLYLKGLELLPSATALAPLGGSSFMASWICILCSTYFTQKGVNHD
jgi:uncharacterized membrane protein YgdD (TMEM256/DUF423 family)